MKYDIQTKEEDGNDSIRRRRINIRIISTIRRRETRREGITKKNIKQKRNNKHIYRTKRKCGEEEEG